MTDKLLIAGGCSNTDPNWHGYISNGITTWPELIGKELDIEVLNTAKVGSSNDRICNMVMDAVIDNENRDLLVMVLWSSHNRLNIFDRDRFVYPPSKNSYLKICDLSQNKLLAYMEEELDYVLTAGINSHGEEINIFQHDQDLLNYNLRAMWKLNRIIKEKNVKFYQACASSLVNDICGMKPYFNDYELTDELYQERVSRLIEYAPTNRYFDESYFTTQHWRNNILFIEDSSMVISEDDNHPNQIGQEWLANTFLLLSESKFNPQPISNRTSIVDFVYD